MKVLCGPASPSLGKKLSSFLGAELLQCEFKRFPDGEVYVRIDEVDEPVTVVQSVCSAEDFIFLTLILDALEGVDKIVVVPYFGYARQDRKFKEGESISIRALARAIESDAEKIVSVNIHSQMAKNHFRRLIEVDAMPVIGENFKEDDIVMISPDMGSLKRVEIAAKYAGCDFDYLEKKRIDADRVEISPKEINVENRRVLIVDDIISTGGTIVEASRVLKSFGAKRVEAVCVHAVFANFALNKLYNAGVEEVTSTDTVEKITSRISVAEEIAEKIKNIGYS
jgi:ribose-phosphate pyrophosphokinase